MKTLTTLFLVLILVISLVGCGNNDIPDDTRGIESTENTSDAETVDNTPTDSVSENNDLVSDDDSAISDESSVNSDPKKVDSEQTPKTATSSSKPVESKPADTNKPPPDDTPPPIVQQEPFATATDANAVANKIVELINQHRKAQGVGVATKLPGLTQVAQYRSKQLVKNYAHNTDDTREATAYYKYGNHVVYEDDVVKLDYYDHEAREAIGKSGGNATVDVIAERMANGFKGSSAHWSYVGGSDYKYIAVGATYGNGEWYICILMSRNNNHG